MVHQEKRHNTVRRVPNRQMYDNKEGNMKRVIGSIAVLVFALLAATAPAQEKINISIGTGGTGGVYYPLGRGMAHVLSKHVPGMQATGEVTGGSGATHHP